jgi:hypothetical protein
MRFCRGVEMNITKSIKQIGRGASAGHPVMSTAWQCAWQCVRQGAGIVSS